MVQTAGGEVCFAKSKRNNLGPGHRCTKAMQTSSSRKPMNPEHIQLSCREGGGKGPRYCLCLRKTALEHFFLRSTPLLKADGLATLGALLKLRILVCRPTRVCGQQWHGFEHCLMRTCHNEGCVSLWGGVVPVACLAKVCGRQKLQEQQRPPEAFALQCSIMHEELGARFYKRKNKTAPFPPPRNGVGGTNVLCSFFGGPKVWLGFVSTTFTCWVWREAQQ